MGSTESTNSYPVNAAGAGTNVTEPVSYGWELHMTVKYGVSQRTAVTVLTQLVSSEPLSLSISYYPCSKKPYSRKTPMSES